MGDIEKVLTEVREAMSGVLKNYKATTSGQLPYRYFMALADAFRKFTADMPGAIGEFYHAAVWAAGHCTEDGDCLECSRTDDDHDDDCMVGRSTAALAKLEVK